LSERNVDRVRLAVKDVLALADVFEFEIASRHGACAAEHNQRDFACARIRGINSAFLKGDDPEFGQLEIAVANRGDLREHVAFLVALQILAH